MLQITSWKGNQGVFPASNKPLYWDGKKRQTASLGKGSQGKIIHSDSMGFFLWLFLPSFTEAPVVLWIGPAGFHWFTCLLAAERKYKRQPKRQKGKAITPSLHVALNTTGSARETEWKGNEVAECTRRGRDCTRVWKGILADSSAKISPSPWLIMKKFPKVHLEQNKEE